ncbi:carbohydrate kinase family protein [Amphibacillus sediminis]|uniref:carbohydrate kinase family protein n=1 Tax=Amphibacillus sediminis TaxID=360185 RepID=UPI0008334D86|nr:carbohydrate kinase [Amphibacillus sediminis]
MNRKVYTIGEALIDFIPNQTNCSLKEVTAFKRVMGGAPANVAVAVAKLGGQSSFISKLGIDAFGDHILEQLENHNVETTWTLRTDQANTGLAFVSLQADGEREFSFYRKPSADMLLTADEVAKMRIGENDILHFCSVSLIDAPIKGAHEQIINYALGHDALVSFDPNVRLPLWDSEEACKKAIQAFIPLAHIVKVSDEELAFITGIDNEEEALRSLFKGNVKWVVYTKGKKGACILNQALLKCEHPGYKVKALDTTGAGDAFVAALLFQLSNEKVNKNDLEQISVKEMDKLLAFCSGYAALTTLKHGAVESLPTLTETLEFIK